LEDFSRIYFEVGDNRVGEATTATEATEAMGTEEEDAVEAIDPTTVSMDATTSCPGVLAAPLSHRARLRASAGQTG